MATYQLEFGKLGDARPVPPLTVQTTDPNVLSRTVVEHARPHITPVLTEMGRPELADCLFQTTPDRTKGHFLWLDLAGEKAASFLPARITTIPERIQRKRTQGWKSNGAKYVGRGTRWGNPFTITRDGDQHIVTNPEGGVILARNSATRARKAAADWYHAWIVGPSQEDLYAAARRELAGLDLMCWCPLPEPGQPDHCHAAVLLKLANSAVVAA